MKTTIKVASVIVVASLLLTGCGYDPHAKLITFIDGKPYRIPYAVKYSRHPLKANDDRWLGYFRAAGMDCRPGDIQWNENRMHDKLLKNTRNKKQSDIQWQNNHISILRQGRKESKVGCAHPLNGQEYNYYLNQQNQQAANTRASDISSAITAPKTHNVNYTGTVYHY